MRRAVPPDGHWRGPHVCPELQTPFGDAHAKDTAVHEARGRHVLSNEKLSRRGHARPKLFQARCVIEHHRVRINPEQMRRVSRDGRPAASEQVSQQLDDQLHLVPSRVPLGLVCHPI